MAADLGSVTDGRAHGQPAARPEEEEAEVVAVVEEDQLEQTAVDVEVEDEAEDAVIPRNAMLIIRIVLPEVIHPKNGKT